MREAVIDTGLISSPVWGARVVVVHTGARLERQRGARHPLSVRSPSVSQSYEYMVLVRFVILAAVGVIILHFVVLLGLPDCPPSFMLNGRVLHKLLTQAHEFHGPRHQDLYPQTFVTDGPLMRVGKKISASTY